MTDLMDLLEMELTDEAAKKEKMDPANQKKAPEVTGKKGRRNSTVTMPVAAEG